MSNAIMTASAAIARSISHTEIVTLRFDAAAGDRKRAMHLKADLLRASDDYAESGNTTEYWGTEDGDEWRVHVWEE